MKFNDAFDKAFDVMEEELKKINPKEQLKFQQNTAKILATMWNILAASDGKFDDFALVDNHNVIRSVPISSAKKGRPAKGQTPDTAADTVTVEGDDGGSTTN